MTSVVRGLAGILLLGCGVLSAVAETASISLDGAEWLIAPDPKNVGWRQHWYRAPRNEAVQAKVPSVIQDPLPGYHGVVWYWRDIAPPVNPNSQGQYLLRFWAVNYKADVWIDGHYLGGHEGGEMPFVVDATRHLQPTRPSRLAVRVLDPRYEFSIDGMNRYETPRRGGPAFQHGGIEDSVDLLLAPSIRITDLYANPDPGTGRIAVQVSLHNASSEQASGTLKLVVQREKQTEWLDTKEIAFQLRPGETVVTAELAIQSPLWWEPESPHLYRVSASTEGGEPAFTDSASVRCGFRDFRFERSAFRLNGKRILLRSAPQSNYDPIGLWLPYDLGSNPDVFQRRLLMAKQMGFNMVRVHRGAARRNMLDFADEIGLLIYEECFASSNFSASPYTRQRFQSSFREMVLRDRSHPSIVIWGLMNEVRATSAQFAAGVQSLPLIRTLDQSRMVLLNSGRWDLQPQIGSLSNPGSYEWQHLLGNESPEFRAGDQTNVLASGTNAKPEMYQVGDIHHYVGFPMTAAARDFFRNLGGSTRHPVLLSEFGVGSGIDLPTLWEFFQEHGSTHLEAAQYCKRMLDMFLADWSAFKLAEVFGGPKEFFRESMLRSARNRLELLNAVRSNPKIAGFSHVSLTERPMLGQGMVSMDGKLKPGTKETMDNALAPVRFCLFVEPTSVYRGEKARFEAVLANADGLPPGNYPVVVKIVDTAGTQVYEKRLNYTVNPRESPLAKTIFSDEITLAGSGLQYRFTAQFANGLRVPGGSVPFYVFDRLESPVTGQEVVLWGSDPKLEEWLRRTGVRTRAFVHGGSSKRELIVASEVPPAPGGQVVFEDLARRVAQGSAVIFLSEKVFRDGKLPTRWLPMRNKGTILTTLNWLFVKDEWVKKHPIFSGVSEAGLMDYGLYRELLQSRQPMFTRIDTPEHAIAGAIGTSSFMTELGVYHSGLFVSEHRLGAGRFLLNTLKIGDQLGRAPQAERLLRNMIEYMASDLAAPVQPLSAATASELASLFLQVGGLAPGIDIVVPQEASVFKSPATVSITVRTSQMDGKIKKVEFFRDGSKIGEDSVKKPDPTNYSLIWFDVPTGSLQLTARVTDEDGRTTTSKPVQIRVE